MVVMARYPDQYFDLACVDPPYGRGEDGGTNRCHGVKQKNGAVLQCLDGGYARKDWDKEPPPPEYFAELRRVAKQQIVWGANYMPVKLQGGAIVWDKVNDGADQSGAEIAYCSLNERVDVVRYMWRGMMQGDGIGSMRQQGNKALNERRIHPCLPAGELVFFDGVWKKIEDVKVGDTNRYGTVSHITQHDAEKLVEIKCGKDKTIATWNHPFLIKRENKIYWINAEQIKLTDFVLSMVSVYNAQKPYLTHEKEMKCEQIIKKHQRDIYGLKRTMTGGFASNIALFGKGIMENCRSACRFTTRILTRQITTFPISNLSLLLSTSGCTLVAELSMENGRSLVKSAENLSYAMKRIGIFLAAGLTGSFAKNASSKKALKQESFLLKKVGSVKIIHQKTKVYNLSIDGIPAFDTGIGVSHNTQKPVKLYEWLLQQYAKPGMKVLDTHLGSGSAAIAAHYAGVDFVGCEIDADYWRAAKERFEAETRQMALLAPNAKVTGSAPTDLQEGEES